MSNSYTDWQGYTGGHGGKSEWLINKDTEIEFKGQVTTLF